MSRDAAAVETFFRLLQPGTHVRFDRTPEFTHFGGAEHGVFDGINDGGWLEIYLPSEDDAHHGVRAGSTIFPSYDSIDVDTLTVIDE